MQNAEYRCGMGIGLGLGLELGSGLRVRVMARAWVGVSIAQFLAVLHIPHCADAEWIWH